MAMVMTLSVTPVFAQTVQSDIGADQNYSVEVMPRAPICPRCGGTTTSKVVWGAWTNKKTQECEHGYAWGTDLIRERTGVKTTTCLTCGDGYSGMVTDTSHNLVGQKIMLHSKSIEKSIVKKCD